MSRDHAYAYANKFLSTHFSIVNIYFVFARFVHFSGRLLLLSKGDFYQIVGCLASYKVCAIYI